MAFQDKILQDEKQEAQRNKREAKKGGKKLRGREEETSSTQMTSGEVDYTAAVVFCGCCNALNKTNSLYVRLQLQSYMREQYITFKTDTGECFTPSRHFLWSISLTLQCFSDISPLFTLISGCFRSFFLLGSL